MCHTLLTIPPIADSTAGQVIDEALTVGEQFWENFDHLVQTVLDNRGNILWNLICILLLCLGGKLLLALISGVTRRVMESSQRSDTPQARRTCTMMTLLRSTARYAVYFVVFLSILSLLGFGKFLGNLLVTAGIGSLAIGFGAQNLVKDVVTGFFMIFENQFSVGDYIKTDEAEGTVEATALRVTYLRSMKGDQIIIPNGSISRVVNYTRGGYMASVTVSTSYEQDTGRIIEILRQTVAQYAAQHRQLIEEEPVVQGITNLGESSVDIGILCKAQPMKQWEVERGIRLAVKECFDANGISFPYPHMVTVPYQPQPEVITCSDIFLAQEAPSRPVLQPTQGEDVSLDGDELEDL